MRERDLTVCLQIMASASLNSLGSSLLLNDGDESSSPQQVKAVSFFYNPRLCGCMGIIILAALFGPIVYVFLSNAAGKNQRKHQTRVVINTWWPGATNATYQALVANWSALDAAIEGCVAAETSWGFGDHTVGPNGSPDTNGETTLDALIVRRRR